MRSILKSMDMNALVSDESHHQNIKCDHRASIVQLDVS